MHEAHRGQVTMLRERFADVLRLPAARHKKWCLVVGGPGHGDHMRAVALCAALKRQLAAEGAEAFVALVWNVAGSSIVDVDIMASARAAGAVDWDEPSCFLPPRLVPQCFNDMFLHVIDARSHAPIWFEDGRLRFAVGAVPFLDIYQEHPEGNWKLREMVCSQFELMAASTGLAVTADDLVAPVALGAVPKDTVLTNREGKRQDPDKVAENMAKRSGIELWEKVEVKGCRYVVVHNQPGSNTEVKRAPAEVMRAVISQLAASSIRAVQIGAKGEEKICKEVIDRRGARFALATRLMQGAVGVVCSEGLAALAAYSVGAPCAVLFGPTPFMLYGLPGHAALVRTVERAEGKRRIACPIGSCFWMPPGTGKAWGRGCQLGPEANERHPHCLNFPEPAEAARQVDALARLWEQARAERAQEAVDGDGGSAEAADAGAGEAAAPA